MKVLDLFSGIGGFSLGLKRAGMTTVGFCEIDPYCRAVLRKHWPEVAIYDDVRTIPRIGGIDLVCGGFPCQPFSVAGKQRGAKDDRHLWPSMFEIIKRERPAWVIGENVTGLIKLGLDLVLSDLENEGYTTRTFIIPAVAVGAPHRRDRLWIVAHSDCVNGGGKSQQPNDKIGEALDDESIGGCADVAHTSGEDVERLRLPLGIQPERDTPCGSSWWAFESNVGRVAHGIPRRVDRLKALGNAVVPQVVEKIGKAIMELTNEY